MARRYCGGLSIYIHYVGGSTYRGSVVCVRASNHPTARVRFAFTDLNAPACGLPVAYDSPEAYDTMAEHAVAFACHYESEKAIDGYLGRIDASELHDASEVDERGEYLIRRAKEPTEAETMEALNGSADDPAQHAS